MPFQKHLLENFFDLSLDMICIANQEGYFVHLNPIWAEVLGHSIEELKSRPFVEFVHPEDVESTIEEAKRLVDPKYKTVSFENRYLCKDGTYKWLSWKSSSKDGYFYAMARDISELKQHQLEFEKLQVSGKIGSWSVNFETMTSPWSDEVYRIHDLEVGSEISVEEGLNFYAPEDRPKIQAYVEKCIATGEPFDDTFRLISAKNIEKRVRSIGHAIYDGDKIVGIYGTFQDVTEEFNKNQALGNITERMKLAVETTKLGVWDWDIVNNILVWDDQMYEIYGVKESDFSGAYEAWQSGLLEEDRAQSHTDVQDALAGVRPFDTEFRVRWPDGSIKWIKAKAEVFRDENGNALRMLGTNFDITEKKNKDIEIQNQRSITIHREKLASIGEIAAGVGHEINNPLAIVMGNASKLLRRSSQIQLTQAEVVEIAEKILSSSDRIAKIVGGLRTFARSNESEVATTNIYSLVETTYGLYKEVYIKGNINFMLSRPLKDIYAKVNPGKFQQILVNMLTNAKDAIKDQPSKSIFIDFQIREEDFSVRVIDNGPGIPEEIQEKVFENFFTTKKMGEGTGIGLALSKTIAHEFGGELSFETSPKGTEFKVTLPYAEDLSAMRVPDQSAQQGPWSYSILVVDDEVGVLDVLRDILETQGCRVMCTSNSEKAVELAGKYSFDYLITDMQMPVMDGVELIKRIEQLNLQRPPKIVAISGGISDDYEKLVKQQRIEAFVSKPFTQQSFLDIFKKAS